MIPRASARLIGLCACALLAASGCRSDARPPAPPTPAERGQQARSKSPAAGSGQESAARAPAADAGEERRVTLVATAEVHGTTAPCGCTSDPLGDVARVMTLAKDGLLLDAGGLLYDPEGLRPDRLPQAEHKADLLARVYARGAVGLGAADLARGPGRARLARQAANVRSKQGLKVAAPRVHQVAGVAIGVFGVVDGRRLKAPGLTVTDPAEAARQAVAQLRRSGAQVVVALLGMDRSEARAVLEAAPGISFGVVGADVGEGMPEPEPVGAGFLVAPADQARRVARIELHLRAGQVVLEPFAGEALRRLRLERNDKRRQSLALQLAAFRKDPEADRAFVAARAEELKELATERTRLEKERPAPPSHSYFTYALEPVRTTIAPDPEVARQMRELDRAIGRDNLAAAKRQPPPPAEAGKPAYVGIEACARCHKPAVAFWRQTVHARAWRTLVEADRQYDYDCVSCHTTGWREPGGVHLASAEPRGLTDVQCETCHGPGSTHVQEAGLEEPPSLRLRPAESFCADRCHTREHSDTFQLVPYLRDVLGKGHGAQRRSELGEGPTAHELRREALRTASGH